MTTARMQLSEVDVVRARILDAAQNRFQTWGFRKTTMAEIAGDTDMSAANLYRYFTNKQEIAAACAGQCVRERLDLLEEVIADVQEGAAAKLRTYVLTSLRHTHQLTEDAPRINELVETILSGRQDIVHWKIEEECKQVSRILQQGVESGEFAIADLATMAEAVHSTLVKFHVPLFMSLYPLDVFEEKALAVVDLLLNGLKKN